MSRRGLTFWRRYRKTKQVHGKDETVFAFILRLRIKPEMLTVYEGVGYHILRSEDDLARVNLKPLARELVWDFLQEQQ